MDGFGEPRVHVSRSAAGNVTLRADWSFRDDMFGEPSATRAAFTHIDSRDLINVRRHLPSRTDGDWSVSAYGKNVTDERC